MTVASRFTGWLARLFRRSRTEVEQATRREFVYLDEVSVYSLLASHKSGVADTFTESGTATRTTDFGGSLGAYGTGVSAGVESSQTQSSQVVRKATVQTHFRELYEIEQLKLAIGTVEAPAPEAESGVGDPEAMRGDSSLRRRIVEPSALSRGELIEVDVELDTDPIFRLSALINSIRRLVDENEVLFEGTGIARLDDMRAAAQVLESLLEGLVPVRGRLTEYAFVTIAGEDALVHTSKLESMPEDVRTTAGPTYVVGVAEHSFFWKDIRRILFTKPRYTMFCRIASTGLSRRWRPTTTLDLLGALAPDFEVWMEEFANQADTAMAAGASGTGAISPVEAAGQSVLREFIGLLASHHNVCLESDVVDELLAGAPDDDEWLGSVDSRRSVLKEVTELLDKLLSVQTLPEIAYEARQAAIAEAALQHPTTALGELGPARAQSESLSTPNHERFLEAEIVAIYW